MKVVALVSGGKDSCYAMMKCIQYGHEIVALANLMPADDSVDELDSFMYQTVGHQIIESYAECMGVPLFRRRIRGSTKHQKLNYRTTPGDEVEDMFVLLSEVKRRIPSVTAVSSGAIASDYQRLRVESVCSRLGLVSLAYLWKQDQSLLLQEMITNGIVAITVKVAAMGLDPEKHLGKELALLKPHLHKLADLYGINVCGEGGEYETLTLDCPLFTNARIVLDEFQIVVPTPGSIASVGFLHPLKFHLESKGDGKGKSCFTKMDNVFEVQGDYPEGSMRPDATEVANSFEVTTNGLCLSKTQKLDTFSISCWTENLSKTSADLQGDLKTILQHIESQLAGYGFGWGQVLYIHLYVNDMSKFAAANDTYVKFITQEKCPFGVPSRSTIELPLLQAGIGSAYVEVLVADDQTKNVMHVQSISSWAPSCIGPYSQATLHKEILLMAGQLGLDPPTMTLGNNGPTAELEQALHNAEAVARVFNCSISTSSILITVYCSTSIPISERGILQDKQDSFLVQSRQARLDEESKLEVLHPLVVYVLVPDLPKRALVEVKPTLYIPDKTEKQDVTIQNLSCESVPVYRRFQHMSWHDSCIQKWIVRSKICAVLLSINHETVTKICSASEITHRNDGDHEISLKEAQIERVSRFCVNLLDKVITENNFSWDDVLNLRLYAPASLNIMVETLSLSFGKAFTELAEMGRNCQAGTNPIYNIVPVVAVGRSAALVDDIITCELLALGEYPRKSGFRSTTG